MAEKLKELLANMSQEEFNRQWAEIEQMGMQGPSLSEVLEFVSLTSQVTGSFEFISSLDQDFSDIPSMAMAA